MLIRLISHPTDNPLHIDKLIYVEGLPDKMVFDTRNGRKLLREPWKMDPVENLPKSIRDAFEPITVTVHTPAFAAPNGEKYPALDDDMEVWALQLDYQNGQGESTWKQIERMIDMSTPRDERLPVPAVVAQNRIENFSLQAEDVPRVSFLKKEESPVTESRADAVDDKKVEMKGTGLRCPVCNKTFDRDAQMRMHKARTGHRESRAVPV